MEIGDIEKANEIKNLMLKYDYGLLGREEELKKAYYEEGIRLYHKNDYENAKKCFMMYTDYRESSDYMLLTIVHTSTIDHPTQVEQLKRLAQNDFEDATELYKNLDSMWKEFY